MALEASNQQQHQDPVPGGEIAGDSVSVFRRAIPATLDLLHLPPPPPFDRQKTGEIYYKKSKKHFEAKKMSRRNGNGPKLDLQLNLSPPRPNPHVNSPTRSASASPPSSCVSSELNQADENNTLRYSNSPEATSMVLVGCPRCLMYVMLSEEDPKCPKCKSTVLLDFHDNTVAKKKKF